MIVPSASLRRGRKESFGILDVVGQDRIFLFIQQMSKLDSCEIGLMEGRRPANLAGDQFVPRFPIFVQKAKGDLKLAPLFDRFVGIDFKPTNLKKRGASL